MIEDNLTESCNSSGEPVLSNLTIQADDCCTAAYTFLIWYITVLTIVFIGITLVICCCLLEKQPDAANNRLVPDEPEAGETETAARNRRDSGEQEGGEDAEGETEGEAGQGIPTTQSASTVVAEGDGPFLLSENEWERAKGTHVKNFMWTF